VAAVVAADGDRRGANRCPNTAGNRQVFGKARDGNRRPFPQIRSVGLGECGTHALLAARPGPIYDGEQELAAGLLDAVEPDMLVIADRALFSFELWAQAQQLIKLPLPPINV
jgi:hypothetical protein